MTFSSFLRPFRPWKSWATSPVALVLLFCGWMVVGAPPAAHGQEPAAPCADTLQRAEDAYRNRNYQDAITLSSQCTDREEVDESTARRAYRIMSLAFLRQGALMQARSAIVSLLAIDPTYTAHPVSDPPSYDLFVSLVRQEMDVGQPPSAPSATQVSSEQGTVFVKPFGVGFSDYTGDYPADWFGYPFDLQDFTRDSFPFVFTFELGYLYTPKFALVLGFQAGNYPIVGYSGKTTKDTDRYTPQLLARYRFGDPAGTVTPYIDGGYNATFGGDASTRPGFGPSIGGGLDIAIGPSTSLYVESRFNLTFPDWAIDGKEDPARDSIFGPFDSVNQLLGFGIKVDVGRLSNDRSPQRQSETSRPSNDLTSTN